MKALALLSGGLDSTLATKIILRQGIEITALNLTSPFCLCNRRGCRYEAKFASQELGIKLKLINVVEEFLEILKNPKHGYGSNMNPCIDCRILMFKKAKEYMKEIAASFVISGEVLGQRPMSQRVAAMKLIDKESGLKGLILRPLSARVLEETIPEKEGWVKREKLYSVTGRSRKPQIALAKELGINDYPCPAGGCLLTDPEFSKRIKDLLTYEKNFDLNDVELLKLGRHFRLNPEAKLVVGRDQEENKRLTNLKRDNDLLFTPCGIKGPQAILRSKKEFKEVLEAVKEILASYFGRHNKGKLWVKITNKDLDSQVELARKSNEDLLERLRI